MVVLFRFIRRPLVTREMRHRPPQRRDDRDGGDQEPGGYEAAPQSALAGREDGPVATRSDHHHEHGPPIDD